MDKYPQTIEEARKVIYGTNKYAFNESRCAGEATDRSNPRWTTRHQCDRKPGKGPGGLYCGTHAKAALSGSKDAPVTEWFQIDFCGAIRTLEVIASTEKTVTTKDGKTEKRGINLFPSKEAAFAEIIRRAESAVVQANDQLAAAQKRHLELLEMKKAGNSR
jgi:hypothetical protein